MNDKKEIRNFIEKIIEEDISNKKNNGKVETRFPPEPNGYLHIGHAKAIHINFSMAEKYNGECHLRFDDTNPEKEESEYEQAIKDDIKWLGFNWGKHLYFASDYFDKLYNYAIDLIKKDLAYVDDLNTEEIREYRGTLKQPGKESPYRNRSIEENLELFEKMKNGDYDNGEKVLRAKIDMKSPNINMRDPVIYRIKKISHHRTGDKWNIYPMYDFTHCISDSIEKITHSLCSLEFEDNRPLYNWFLEHLETPGNPRQIEFAKLNINYTVMSKRNLIKLVSENYVNGWDDPRLPTLRGMKRRGYTPESIKNFLDAVGVAKAFSVVDYGMLEYFVREHLNQIALRKMAVLDPLKIIITNYPEDKEEWLDADNNPNDLDSGKRQIPFSNTLYIEQNDFMETPPKKFFRLTEGREVRLMHAYYITCKEVIKDINGKVIELHCTYDPNSKGGWTEDARKVKGTLHWVSAKHCLDAEIRLYNHLFNKENPYEFDEGLDFTENINNESLIVNEKCKVEPSLSEVNLDLRFQFLRQGYFCLDKDSTDKKLIFNRTVGLRDSWAKINKK